MRDIACQLAQLLNDDPVEAEAAVRMLNDRKLLVRVTGGRLELSQAAMHLLTN